MLQCARGGPGPHALAPTPHPPGAPSKPSHSSPGPWLHTRPLPRSHVRCRKVGSGSRPRGCSPAVEGDCSQGVPKSQCRSEVPAGGRRQRQWPQPLLLQPPPGHAQGGPVCSAAGCCCTQVCPPDPQPPSSPLVPPPLPPGCRAGLPQPAATAVGTCGMTADPGPAAAEPQAARNMPPPLPPSHSPSTSPDTRCGGQLAGRRQTPPPCIPAHRLGLWGRGREQRERGAE